jgi:pimeloyl-ACP methyl ester carboxylesterase
VQAQLANNVRSCAFDRAGFGFSDPAPQPQSMFEVTSDLHAALGAAGIKPPYVLVGHSLGALEMRIFAYRWPDEFVGMVLVDSSFANQISTIEALPHFNPSITEASNARRKYCWKMALEGKLLPGRPDYASCVAPPPAGAPPELVNIWPTFASASAFASGFSLWNSVQDQETQPADTIHLGSKPLIVLTAGMVQPVINGNVQYQSEFRGMWLSKHEQLTKLSTIGKHQLVANTDHAMLEKRPDAVVSAIIEVLDKSALKH